MFCKNCGKEIADSSKFCVNCGTPVDVQRTAPVYEQPAASAPVDSAPVNRTRTKKNKKKIPVWVYIVVVLGAAVIGRLIGDGVIAPSLGGEIEPFETKEREEIVAPEFDLIVNPDYVEIFSSRYIVESPPAIWSYESSIFATVDADGIIERLEYGHEGDIVKEMFDTLYYPVSGMSDSEKEVLSSQLNLMEMNVVADGFCTATKNTSDSYYSITFHFINLENSQNIQKMYELGMLGSTGDMISMEQTESNLLSSGFIKR